jgi:predicted Zn-dependent protease
VTDQWAGLGDEVRSELLREFGGETEDWAIQRVARVMARLNGARSSGSQLIAEILWVRQLTAFTAPGAYVYISRRLLEKLPSDEALAFVFAHEAAHHDLGHLELFAGWAEWVPGFGDPGSSLAALPGTVIATVLRIFEHRVYGPEREAAADVHAVDLCLAAGYSGQLCLQALEILENELLDRRAGARRVSLRTESKMILGPEDG